MSAANLLVELLVEELPPKALKKLGEVFADALAESLVSQGLANPDAEVENFATPRRLGVRIANILARAADKPISTKLMPVSVGLDADGKATPALLKRLTALGADASAVSQLRRAADGKNEALVYDSIAHGTALINGLQLALETAMAKLPIPKVMTYQLEDGWRTVNFVRPVHGLVALHGSDIVPVSVLGLHAGRNTQGHRFEARMNPVVVSSADSYAMHMKDDGAVIASFAERRAEIVRQLQVAAESLSLKPTEDDALLDEVTALVERPNVLIGKFEETFLDVPPECLILTMKANQKYFPLLDAEGKLTNRFLIVSNISPADPSAVIQGNERVVRPRLADAKFFYDQDRKKTLESRVPGLAKVVYHNKLGSQGERVERVRIIARAIGYEIGGEALALEADQAALLAKADLLTDMVGEFPELQGTMGRYYALHDGLGDSIALALEDHYKPRFAGDGLPRNDVGKCVALADKLETLVGMFGIGEKPTGDKDPFALRRHALGLIRILAEQPSSLKLNDLFNLAAKAFGDRITNPANSLVEFTYERLRNYFREPVGVKTVDASIAVVPGYSPQIIEAVLALKPNDIYSLWGKLQAVREFDYLPEAENLASANKRVGNILYKAEAGVYLQPNPKHFVSIAEIALFKALSEVAKMSNAAYEAGDYTTSLKTLAALKAPVDAFFDNVMVNADDPELRANRLALLNQLHQTMNRVADISKLAA